MVLGSGDQHRPGRAAFIGIMLLQKGANSVVATSLDVGFGTLASEIGPSDRLVGMFNLPGSLGNEGIEKLDLDGVAVNRSGLANVDAMPAAESIAVPEPGSVGWLAVVGLAVVIACRGRRGAT